MNWCDTFQRSTDPPSRLFSLSLSVQSDPTAIAGSALGAWDRSTRSWFGATDEARRCSGWATKALGVETFKDIPNMKRFTPGWSTSKASSLYSNQKHTHTHSFSAPIVLSCLAKGPHLLPHSAIEASWIDDEMHIVHQTRSIWSQTCRWPIVRTDATRDIRMLSSTSGRVA